MTYVSRIASIAAVVAVATFAGACGQNTERTEQGSNLAATSSLFAPEQNRISNITQMSANTITNHANRFATDNIFWRRTQFNDLTRMARCMVVINSGELGWGLGGAELGAGMASCRTADGTWSAPSYLHLVGGTLGPIIGAEQRQVVMLFMSTVAVNRLMHNVDFNLGAGVRAAAFTANIGVDVNTAMHNDIITFTYTRGVIAEAAINGSIIRHMNVRNQKVYGQPVMPAQILSASQAYTPIIARPFVDALNFMERVSLTPVYDPYATQPAQPYVPVQQPTPAPVYVPAPAPQPEPTYVPVPVVVPVIVPVIIAPPVVTEPIYVPAPPVEYRY